MKKPACHPLALLAACALLPTTGLLAQSPSPAASSSPSVSAPAASPAAEAEEHEGSHMKAYSKLTPEEQQKLKAANKIAMEDPTVKAAEANRKNGKDGRKAFMDARRAAMIKADPSVQPILDKMREERREEHPDKKDF